MTVWNKIRQTIDGEMKKIGADRAATIETIWVSVVTQVRKSIKDRRAFLRLRQSDLADAAGLKQPAISRLENSKGTGLSLSTLQAVASAMDMVVIIELVPRTEAIDRLSE